MKFDLAPGALADLAKYIVSGPITLNNLFSLQTALRSQSASTVVLDLSEVPYYRFRRTRRNHQRPLPSDAAESCCSAV